MIVVDGVRWGTAAEIAAQLGHGVTPGMVRKWASRDGLASARIVDGKGRPQVRYPLLKAASLERSKRGNVRRPRART